MIRAFLVVAGLTCSCVTCFAQSAYSQADMRAVEETPAAIDVSPQLAELVTKHNVPALAAVLIEGGVIRVEGVAGVRANGSDAKATLDDQWHLGSCTKAMTATLAALMVDRQQLSWDTPLFEAFPKLAEEADAGWGKATLGMFVTNTSGTPGGLDRDGLWGRLWNTNEPPAEARRMLIAGVTKFPPVAEPGTKFEYANGGFAIAGAMMERMAGLPYEELLRRELFEPLGITSAGFAAPGVPGVTAQPMGHTKEGKAHASGRQSDGDCARGLFAHVDSRLGEVRDATRAGRFAQSQSQGRVAHAPGV
jgi:CubicO group peptidase (beta-lactamase class C family)